MSVDNRVMKIIHEKLGIPMEDIQPEKRFKEDFGADSLDLVELIMDMEEEFGMDIADDDAEKIKTVKETIDYIHGHM